MTLPVTVPSGHAVCATATNLTTNNTSEFSAFASAPTDSDIDGVTDDIDIDDDNDGIPDDIEDLGFDSRGGTIACTQPAMNFQNPVLVSGTANTAGRGLSVLERDPRYRRASDDRGDDQRFHRQRG